jgi:hypothetical protein
MRLKAVLALLAALALVPSAAFAVLNVGDQAPDFTIPDTAWVDHHLTEWRGKVVLIQFWQQF